VAEESPLFGSPQEIEREVERLTKQMKKASKELEFEKAAELRDRIRELKQLELFES
jgi:excinuclease ABC subunit B